MLNHVHTIKMGQVELFYFQDRPFPNPLLPLWVGIPTDNDCLRETAYCRSNSMKRQ